MKTTLIALVFAATAVAAQAHHVWIEQDAQGAKLYFGEFGENMREASPGLLDKFPGPVATRVTADGDSKPAVTKTANGFAIAGRAGKGESIVAEEAGYASYPQKDGDKTIRGIYVPAARLVADFAKQAPKLTLDIVPTGKAGDEGVEFQVVFKGKPLPKAKIEVINTLGWNQEHRSDDNGLFTVKLPWQGTYVLELQHRDNAGGERASGEKYDRASYVTSLTVLQPSGLPTLPVPPVAAPSKSN
ncbi:MAG: DUF4198 domain-containing protein [Rhizobacter sp.]